MYFHALCTNEDVGLCTEQLDDGLMIWFCFVFHSGWFHAGLELARAAVAEKFSIPSAQLTSKVDNA